MRNQFIYILLICIAVSGYAQKRSSIDFVIKNIGINVDGHFNTFRITSIFNENNGLESVLGEIEVASIETGIDSRDEHLLEPDYFNASDYPKIKLKSSEIRKVSEFDYEVKASLTIKGTTKTIVIPISVQDELGDKILQSYFEINRRDFSVGGSSFVLSKTVKISVIHYHSE